MFCITLLSTNLVRVQPFVQTIFARNTPSIFTEMVEGAHPVLKYNYLSDSSPCCAMITNLFSVSQLLRHLLLMDPKIRKTIECWIASRHSRNACENVSS